MNRKLLINILSKMMLVEAALLLPPALVSIIYSEWHSLFSFLAVIGIILVIFIPLAKFIIPEKNSLYAKGGLVTVALAWILWSLFGALPFYFEGCIPNYIDALFETVSGFTTTGATILNDVEVVPYGMLFWRSFTHWIGGMGVLVFVMAIIPLAEGHSLHLMKAEVPGPTVGKLVPKGKSTATILYLIYIAMTIIQIIMLYLGDMPLFDSIIHSFSTAGTGGFSCKNASLAAYNSPYIEYVCAAFMLLFGINFNIYYFILIRKLKNVFKDSEWKVYLLIILLSGTIIVSSSYQLYDSLPVNIRTSIFQVISYITTTGFCTIDQNILPELPKMLLLMLMVIGGCAGSTAGGMKVSRIMLMFKNAGLEIKKMLHPKTVNVVKLDGKIVTDDTISGLHGYFAVYIIGIILSVLVISINGFDFETTFSSVLTTINNVGPALGKASATFSCFSSFSKLIFCFIMLLGRLEFFPMLMIFSRSVWKKKFF